MDKDTHVSLHRSKMGRVDRMIKSGPFEDLYREFKAVAPSTQSEYFMMEVGRKVGPQEIEDWQSCLALLVSGTLRFALLPSIDKLTMCPLSL